jgi:glycosyltransferase involved in cell wall biosynthesis
MARADVVCQPSLSEPFGQALLEAMAMERAVIGTVNGGPAEFVNPALGLLVDPADPGALAPALAKAASLGTPVPAARVAASVHDVRRQAARMADVLGSAISEA